MANEIDFRFLELPLEVPPNTATQLRMRASYFLGQIVQGTELPLATRIDLAFRILKEVPLPED